MNTLVTARELAALFGIDRSGVLKWAKRHGVKWQTKRDPERGNQAEAAVPEREARRLMALREGEGFELKKEERCVS